jgi:tetratricopeptide (TPR) repeat protein
VSRESPQRQLEGAADRVALAAILAASGRYAEAAAALDDALTAYEHVLGPEHYEVAAVLLDLARVAEHSGEAVRAAELRARAQQIRRRVVGHTHRRSG